jgi:hypothetical protein
MHVKPCAEPTMTKNEPRGNSRPYAHVTEHLVCLTENPPQEYNKNRENSNLVSGGSRGKPASSQNQEHEIAEIRSSINLEELN